MKLYKLTDQDGYTRRGYNNETLWGEGVTHTAMGTGGLCTDGVIHAYEHPLIAVFMNPIHAEIRFPVLWEAEGEIAEREGQLKCGVKTLTTLRRVEIPSITAEQRCEVAIRAALAVYAEPRFARWAQVWLTGKNRTEARAPRTAEAAAAAAAAAEKARTAEKKAAAQAAAAAAEAAAARAEEAAARTEEAARTAAAARTAWKAAAARTAWTAWTEAAGKTDFDLLSLLTRVTK